MSVCAEDFASYTDEALAAELQSVDLLLAMVARVRDEAKAEGNPDWRNADAQLPNLDAKRTLLIRLLRERGVLITPPAVEIRAKAALAEAVSKGEVKGV